MRFILFFFLMKTLLSFILVVFICASALADAEQNVLPSSNKAILISMEIINGDTLVKLIATDTLSKQKVPSTSEIVTNEQKKKKILAGFLSFPFPLGFLGAHRIMMGTKPWVPIAYVATFGGCFGLLPLVDFCVIMFSDNIEQYENNPNIFMWIK